MGFLVGEGTEHDPNWLPLATKKGWKIPNARSAEFEDFKLLTNKDISLSLRKHAELRSISGTYNCAGLVFAARRTYIEDKHIQRILDDDGYRRITRDSDIVEGDVIVYRRNNGNILHIGVVVRRKDDFIRGQVTFSIISKWGEYGEFIHDPNDVPGEYLRDTVIEYWTERKLP